jgi:hypothetical protein
VDNHTGPTHDMPDYVPNWPVVVKVKAKVAKGLTGLWYWGHSCPRDNSGAFGAHLTQAEALAAALKHARGCW